MKVIRLAHLAALLAFLFNPLPAPAYATEGSANPLQVPAPGVWAGEPSISWDGRWIAYVSHLQKGITASLVFLYDRQTNANTQLSTALDAPPDGVSYEPAISADGAWVAFTSTARNLVTPPGAGIPGRSSIFLVERTGGKIWRLPVTLDGSPANGWSDSPCLSADGRFLAFASRADNLVKGDRNQLPDIFVYDRLTGQTQLVSVSSTGEQADGISFNPAISADGRFVAFLSQAGNLTKDPAPAGGTGLYLHDHRTGITVRIQVVSQGNAWETELNSPALAADGKTLSFVASYRGQAGIYLFDIKAGQAKLVENSLTSQPGSLTFSLSTDGRYLVYTKMESRADEAWLYDRLTGKEEFLITSGPNSQPGFNRGRPALSAGARYLILSGSVSVDPSSNRLESSMTLIERTGPASSKAFITGWVTDGLGHPLAGVEILDGFETQMITARDGSFSLEYLVGSPVLLKPEKQGYSFNPSSQVISPSQASPVSGGIQFIGSPSEVIEAAQQDLGMPYSMNRGCPQPGEGCGGPFSGFYAGVCTDLIIDAYREAANFNLQVGLGIDFTGHPDHYYSLHDIRNTGDMWRYFLYTGQALTHNAPYQPGDIVFFDWEKDGVVDHVALVAKVDAAGRPKKILDASGKTNENPQGLATVQDWRYFHEGSVVGHARWLGTSRTPANLPKYPVYLLVSLDSPTIQLSIRDSRGQRTSAAKVEIQGSGYQDFGTGKVISLGMAENTPGIYTVDLSGASASPYQIGVQMVKNGNVEYNYISKGTRMSGDSESFPLELTVDDGELTLHSALP